MSEFPGPDRHGGSVDAVDAAPQLTPTQERTLNLLRRPAEPLVFDAEVVDGLVEEVRAALAELSVRLGGEKLFVNKGFLNRVHGCEVQHLAPSDFGWNPQNARGFVAHKAIELLLNWRGEPHPGDLVDEAIARLADEPGSRGAFVAALTDADRADLRSGAVARVTRFLESFPPIPVSAAPVTEGSSSFRPDGTIVLNGKPDLTLGRLEGRESRRVIIDLKSGGRNHTHRDDLRFYALVETLTQRVPPRKLVTYYLDEAEPEVEDVTEGVLRAAARRTLDGIERHVELTVERRPPVKRVGAPCRWCPVRDACPEGEAFLRGTDPEAITVE